MEQSNNLFELQIDHQASAFLRETAKWSKFLAIVGFIFIGLILIVVAVGGSAMSGAMATTYGSAMSGMMGTGLIAGIMLIYLFPCLYLFRFATKMQVALRSNDQETLNSSFENLKSCFKFMGILMIIILSIYALAFLVVIAAGAGLA
jgi:uncharacterized membrane protein